jgi:hypothetical protein
MNEAVERKLWIVWINCIRLQIYGTEGQFIQESLSEPMKNIFPDKLNDFKKRLSRYDWPCQWLEKLIKSA